MKTYSILTAFMAAVVPFLVEATVSTYSQTGCVTRLTTKKPSSVPTTTNAKTLSLAIKVTTTTTPLSTKTPLSATTTVVSTSTSSITTTLSQVTDTATTTVTSTETDLTTTTLPVYTETAVSITTTTSTMTTTVPASAGFTPLASELSASGYTVGTAVANSRRRSLGKLEARAAGANKIGANAAIEARATATSTKKACIIGGPSQYPAAVSCYRLVEVVSTSTIVSTAKTTRTITLPQGTVTFSSTKTVTTTLSTMLVHASSTITASASTTITNIATASPTTTTTSISVATSFAPQATFYAACAANNLVSSINGRAIIDASYNLFAYYVSTAFTSSAYDCCVMCLQTTGCRSAYSTSGSCALLIAPSSVPCNGASRFFDLGTAPGDAFATVSNSNCGQAFYDGSLG